MTLTQRVKAAWSAFKAPENRYEAAQPSSPDRAWIPAFVRDARFDANSFSRWEMVRKIRYFERNVWLLQALGREYRKWTIGPNGLQVLPASSEPEFNQVMQDAYLDWCESPCLDSTLTMPQLHKQMANARHLEGECFLHKTRLKLNGKPSRPAVQLIEGHRCSTPGENWSMQDRTDVIDGVVYGTDAAGKQVKPIGYWIRDDLEADSWNFRSVTDMRHVWDPTRIGMPRDITPYHGVLNTLADLNELELMEMQRAKANSEIANVITNAAGEITGNMRRMERYGTSPAAGTPDDKDFYKKQEMYRRVLGSRTIALKTGEAITQLDNKNPSAATQWLWRYKLGEICNARGIPLLLVFPEMIESIQGTVVRGIYDNAHEFFRGEYFILASAALDMYRYFAQWARYNVPKLADAPADWLHAHVIPPRAVNVDVGYTSQANIAELAVGLQNMDDLAGQRGTTAEVLLRKKAKNVKLIHDLATEFKVDPAEISAPIADVLQKMAQANAAEQSATEPEEMAAKDE